MAAPFIVPPPPLRIPLPALLPGRYGISYDIFTRNTEDDLPNGWNSYRCQYVITTLLINMAHISISQQIPTIQRLNRAGFIHEQLSDYVNPLAAPALVWTTMVSLCFIDPPGKLESTVRGLKMHLIEDDVCIVTHDIRLGGVYSLSLRGPTPRNLLTPATAAAMVPAPAIPAVVPALPRYTRNSVAATIAANWVQ